MYALLSAGFSILKSLNLLSKKIFQEIHQCQRGPMIMFLSGSTLFVKVINRWLLARKELSDWLIDKK